MKKILLLTVTVLFCSCSKKDSLEIQILNNNISCVYSENNDYPVLDSTYDKLSLNKITYCLKNNSNKKYFIYFNNNRFDTFEKDKDRINASRDVADIYFNLYDNDKLITGSFYQKGHSTSEPHDYFFDKRNFNAIADGIQFEKNKRKGIVNDDIMEAIKQNEVMQYGFVLHPGEIKYFTTSINLPQRTPYENIPWKSNIDSTKKYTASITLKGRGKQTELYLTQDVKRNIKENGYIIFEGIIKSNNVPVQLIKFKSNYKSPE